MATQTRRQTSQRGRLGTTTSGISGIWESGIFNLDDDALDSEARNCTSLTETDSLPSSFYAEQPHLQKSLENDPQRRYKISVIKDLLRNFSLEDTVAHYKALPSCSFTVSPANFSYDWQVNKMEQKYLEE
ncbi:hypothetical protein CAPTEDRAFT_206809 [Capitella teleta]|uniref:Uncharacterized protein n=1 Tax=Capitella teleta TaxID=283909 RepID=R7T5A6_CAPTE|nr:hypothetical protein CAPTEDRAFT_206809 [Capitella teleta]|eukprot:ELT88504.1 hypothetical protein CAPTEDRAFT_206809 [Capitella teleta]